MVLSPYGHCASGKRELQRKDGTRHRPLANFHHIPPQKGDQAMTNATNTNETKTATEIVTLEALREHATDWGFIEKAAGEAFETFGRGAAILLRAFCHGVRSGLIGTLLDFPFTSEVDGMIEWARAVGLKEFGFRSQSSEALAVLTRATEMGATVRFSKESCPDIHEDDRRDPVAWVTVG